MERQRWKVAVPLLLRCENNEVEDTSIRSRHVDRLWLLLNSRTLWNLVRSCNCSTVRCTDGGLFVCLFVCELLIHDRTLDRRPSS